MKFKRISLLILSLGSAIPTVVFAHLLSITASTPFPETVVVSSITKATFTITNITSKVTLTAVDQSIFPPGSGLSISSSTCGNPLAPGQSCSITLQLNAPARPQTISAELREWAKPSADGIRFPFTITIIPLSQFIVTPTAGTNGTISPNSPQTVSSGSNLTFTAIPDAGYMVTQWLLDNILTQTGGTSYLLSNITSNHSVNVSFSLIDWTAWTEDSANPIYNPGKAYYPSVIYDAQQFGDNSAFYKMWYEGNNEIGLAYSNDGINWTSHSTTGLPAEGAHPDVVYDANGFGGGIYNYKMWYWDPNASLSDISAIKFSESTDGVNWTTPVSISQNPSFPLVTGISPGYFYHLYGPGYVIYNPGAVPVPGQPMTYPYVMFFDTSTEGAGPGTSVEQTGLAYSTDGLFWTRYGTVPVIIPSGDINQWDGQYIYQPSVIKVQGIYQMFYSGSNGQPIGSAGNTTAHGIGHASSTDGINWTLDSGNPIFYILDGVSWRNNRTYTPAVIFDPFCSSGNSSNFAKMWFTGANSSDIRAIGYATMPCPSI